MSKSNASTPLSTRVIALAVAAMLVPAAPAASADISGAMTNFSLVANAQNNAKFAAAILASESPDDIADGYPLPPAMQTGGAGPTGGGLIPASSNAVKTDGTATRLGYCAWDNGTSTGAANRIAGSNTLNSAVFAVVTPGLNGAFNTSCAQISAAVSGGTGSGAQGDDFVVVYNSAQLRSLYSLHVGPAVANSAALNAIPPSALRDGEIRLQKSDNSLMRWDGGAASWVSVGGTSGSNGNTATGAGALISVTTGADNSAFGVDTLRLNTTGSSNAATGARALRSNTTGGGNTASGADALFSNTTGSHNAATGLYALYLNTTGSSHVAIGSSALYNHNSVLANTGFQVAVGSSAAQYIRNATANSPNVVIGGLAMGGGDTATVANNTASNNVGVGYQVLGGGQTAAAITGANNVAMGNQSLLNLTTGSSNVAIGTLAGVTATPANTLTTGSNNTFLGHGSGFGNTTQRTYATAIGSGALVTSSNTIALGRTTDTTVIGATGNSGAAARLQVTGGLQLVGQAGDLTGSAGMIAYDSTTNQLRWHNGTGWGNLSGGGGGGVVSTNGNIAIGHLSLFSNTSGHNHVAIGTNALYNHNSTRLHTGYQIAIGSGAAQLIRNVSDNLPNVVIGGLAMSGGSAGSPGGNTAHNNVGVGHQILGANSTTNVHGANNVAIGNQSLFNMTGSHHNVAIGAMALRENNSGSGNIAIGSSALWQNTTGSSNVAIGTLAGVTATPANTLTTGSNNTFLGNGSGFGNTTQHTYATAIGSGALVSSNNTIVLGRASNDRVVVNATAVSGTAATDGFIQIGGSGTNITGIAPTTNSTSTSTGLDLGSSTRKWRYVHASQGTIQTSDIRLKTNIETISGNEAISVVKKIPAIRYSWLSDLNGQRQVGSIAQEVQKAMPELVITGSDPDKTLGVMYAQMAPVLAAAVTELDRRLVEAEKTTALFIRNDDGSINVKTARMNVEGEVSAIKIKTASVEAENAILKNILAKRITADEVLDIFLSGNDKATLSLGGNKVSVNAALHVSGDLTSGNLFPKADNAHYLGHAGNRWSAGFFSQGIYQTADARVMNGTQTMGGDEAIDILGKTRAVRYAQQNGSKRIAFIAQELQAALPEVVHAPLGDDDYYGINYAEITPLLASAINKHQETLSAFKPSGSGAARKIKIEATLEAAVVKFDRVNAAHIETDKLKANEIEANRVSAGRFNSGEIALATDTHCRNLFDMKDGAVYEVRAIGHTGGWGSMRIGFVAGAPVVQDRKVSDETNGVELNVNGAAVCATTAGIQNVKASWMRVI